MKASLSKGSKADIKSLPRGYVLGLSGRTVMDSKAMHYYDLDNANHNKH
jgi:hypothetical protein